VLKDIRENKDTVKEEKREFKGYQMIIWNKKEERPIYPKIRSEEEREAHN